MAKKKRVDSEVAYASARPLRRALILAALILVLVVVSLGYLYQDAIIEAKNSVVHQLGLGIAPASLWVAVFLFALAKRRRWLLH
ncbi:MAG: hypothetical protein ACRDIB_08025, partial [Ardenticatenaceae bacterium]